MKKCSEYVRKYYFCVRHTVGFCIFGLFRYPLQQKNFKGIKIASIEDTLNLILLNNVSISRYGDGEFAWLCMIEHSSFQDCSEVLRDRLREVLVSNLEGHAVCIAPELVGLEDNYKGWSKAFWKRIIGRYGKHWARWIDFDKQYYNTNISRPYVNFRSNETAKKYFKMWKEIWKNKHILIIEGEKTRFGVGNNLFDNVSSIERILAPAKNAFDEYESILNAGLRLGKNKLILIALGPTATVLAYDLAKAGYWAIDIGHLDVEYEWFLRGTDVKIPLNGKYVNETGTAGGDFTEMEEEKLKEYYLQVVARIGTNRDIS